LLLKKTDIRSTQVKRGWVRELNHYLKSNKLSTSDPGYIRQLNSAIANRGNYEMFELAPAAFCLQQLEDYLEITDKKDQAVSDDLKKVQMLLSTLASQERKQAERDVQQTKRKAPTNTSAAPTTVNSPLSKKPTLVPNLDLGGLKNRPFAEDPIDSENTSASTKTEPSDSTDVETEGSQDEQVANNNVGNVENEKNKD
jgi:hypothetical protein